MNPSQNTQYDAIIIGASISGCICALALADRNWRVAIIEKRSDAEHYKKICTHIIHPSGVKVLRKLGLYEKLDQSSALPTCMQLNYGDSAIYYPAGGKATAANIERKDLDPLLRNAASQHPNIDLIMGAQLSAVTKLDTQLQVRAHRSPNSAPPIILKAPLLVGADGRQGDTARLAGGKLIADTNKRVAVFAYFNHPENHQSDPISQESRIWALDQGDEYVGYFPNRKHILVSWYLSELAYRNLKETSDVPFLRALKRLEENGLKVGTEAVKPAVAKRTAPVRAKAMYPGTCLIGDAKLAADPLTGVGCSWAMSSAYLLANRLPRLEKPGTSTRLNKQIHRALSQYHVLHTLKYRLPSAFMTFMSLHGKWVFNRAVFKTLAWATGKHSGLFKDKPTPP